jgi:hypothetical protein
MSPKTPIQIFKDDPTPTWKIWVFVGDVKLTLHYLIREYRTIIDSQTSGYGAVQAAVTNKALLLRDAIRRGVVVFDEYND